MNTDTILEIAKDNGLTQKSHQKTNKGKWTRRDGIYLQQLCL